MTVDDDTLDHCHPCARVTIADGEVTLNPWSPGLLCGGPTRALLADVAERGVQLADITRIGYDEEELLVTFLTPGPHDDTRAALIDWAWTAGYRRVWLDDVLVVLEDRLAVVGNASVDCPTCRATWSDANTEFWEGVRAAGWFPGTCRACGGSLPEWSVEAAARYEGSSATAAPSESAVE